MTDKPMTDQIASCPFCGHIKLEAQNVIGGFYIACCNFDCEAAGPAKHTRAEAIAAWNRVSAAVKLAEVAGEWLRKVEAAFGPAPDDWVLPSTIGMWRITVGMIRATGGSVDKST